MQHVLETSKRVFSAAIAAATIAFSIGAGALVSPATAQAATAGSNFRSPELSTVYYMGYDGMRYTYPTQARWFSWYTDFSSVVTMSAADIADIDLGGNVVIRPGGPWVKITSDNKVYAVARDGMIHWIESEDVAKAFAGDDWNDRIIDDPDVFFDDHTVGTSLMSATAYEGMLYKMGGVTYLVWDGEMREVTSAGMSANGFQAKDVMDGSGIDDSTLTMGDDVTSKETALVDVAQTEEGSGPVVAGDVEVSLASSTPNGATVPKGANSVEVFSFDVEAGSEDAMVNSVTTTLYSVGATTNIANAYLYMGDTRLTDARTVNSSTRQVTFTNLDLAVEAGDEVTLTVRVEVSTSASAGDDIGFSIDAATDIDAGGDVDGSFPIEGEIFNVANSSAGEIDITESGSIVDPTIGQNDAVIGEFKITTNSEAADVQMITLKIDNAVDHDDFKLWDGTVLLAEGEYIGDKLVTFVLDDGYDIAEGGNNIFQVSADIGGEDGDDVAVYVDNKADVVAIGGDFGFGMTVDIDDSNGYDGTSCTSTSGKCSFSDVQGGEITMAFGGPSAGDIGTNAQDQTLFAFTFTAENEITVQDLDFIVYGDDNGDNDAVEATDDGTDTDDDGLIVGSGTNEAAITDIKIVNADTGAVVMGPMELDGVADSDDDADQTIDFTDDFMVEAGETLNLELRVDVDNSVTSGTEFAAALDISGFVAEDANGDAVASGDIVPSSDLTGYNQEANASSLTIQLASSPISTTVVQGKANVEMMGFSVRAGDASDVTIESLTLTGYADDTNASAMTVGGAATFQIEDYVSSCSLYNDSDVRLDGPKSISTAGALVFDTLDWELAASQTELLTLKCNLANPSDTDDDVIAFEIAGDGGVTTAVTASDEDGNSPTITLTAAGSGNDGINDTNTTDAVLDASMAVTVTPSGTITAAASSSTPSADILVTGTNDNYVGEFNFTAATENFLIDKLVVNEEAATDDGLSSASAYANNISKVKITYTGSDNTMKTHEAVMSGRAATFTGLSLLAKTGQNNYVKVYVNVPSHERNTGGSATSNEEIEVGLSSTSGDFNAVGIDSGVTDVAANASETNKVFLVKETKPTLTTSASTPSGTKVPGDIEVLRFNVAAHSNEDVVLNELVFKMNASDNNGEGSTDNQPDWNECDSDVTDGTYGIATLDLDLYNLSEEGTGTPLDVNADWSLLSVAGAACTTTQADVGFIHLTLTTAELVPAGSTYTYALYFDASGAAAANDDVVQFEIPTDPAYSSYVLGGANALDEADVAITDTTISVDSGAVFTAGDVIVLDLDDGADYDSGSEEVMLVTGVSSNDLTVIRGYLGTTRNDADAGSGTYEYENTDGVLRFPSSLYWEDDGNTSSAGTGEDWGSYLVDSPVVGGALAF